MDNITNGLTRPANVNQAPQKKTCGTGECFTAIVIGKLFLS
jgi:hypothetical protein